MKRNFIALVRQMEYPLFKVLETRSVSRFGFFFILEYLYVHNEISWRQDPNLNMKFICVSYMPYICSLKLILCNILKIILCMKQSFDHVFTVMFHMRLGMEFSVCGFLSTLRVSEFGTFWISNFQMFLNL